MIPEKAKEIMKTLLLNGFEAYIIGGYVRDTILGLEPKDVDIFSNASGPDILRLFPQGRVIGGEARQAKILTVVVDGIEVSQYRSNGARTETGTSLVDHITTCDFTINALAMDINGQILDYVSGEKDIGLKVLRFVGKAEDRVREDPLRLFRGIRFVVKYHLNIVQNAPYVMFKQYVQELPKERIRDELLKIIVLPDGLQTLDFFGMLEWIIPEWANCKGLDGGPHHAETLGEHTFIALNTAQTYTSNPMLLLGIFLHDIGKPASAGVKEESGLATFYNHHTIGRDYVKDWMRAYKFSEDEVSYVTTIIEHHMMGKTGLISQRTFAYICNDLVNAKVTPEDMLVVTFSDNQANKLNPRLKYNEFITNNGFLQRYYEAKYGRYGFNPNDLEVNGKDIINIMNISGPAIGVVKKELFDMVCDGTIINRRDRLIEELRNRRDKNKY